MLGGDEARNHCLLSHDEDDKLLPSAMLVFGLKQITDTCTRTRVPPTAQSPTGYDNHWLETNKDNDKHFLLPDFEEILLPFHKLNTVPLLGTRRYSSPASIRHTLVGNGIEPRYDTWETSATLKILCSPCQFLRQQSRRSSLLKTEIS